MKQVSIDTSILTSDQIKETLTNDIDTKVKQIKKSLDELRELENKCEQLAGLQ